MLSMSYFVVSVSLGNSHVLLFGMLRANINVSGRLHFFGNLAKSAWIKADLKS
jgi:hypothetical protein